MQLKRLVSSRGALVAVGLVLALALYVAGVPKNPPGFFVDESSIAYNAYAISQHGIDEHGERWPLYFKAFGEYKNPAFIYLLAAAYSIFGPSQFAARLLSALAGLAAALLLGMLASRAMRRPVIGIIVGATACLTPWLFEVSRLAFEVVLLPLAIALFLWLLQVALRRDRPLWRDGLYLAVALALITYTSGAGRVLAPLFCLGLLLADKKSRWALFARTLLFYVVTLIPLLLFLKGHPGALGVRFGYVSILASEKEPLGIALTFLGHYFRTFNPWSWLVTGDPEPRHHLATMGSVLFATAALGYTGLALFFRRQLWRDPWWRWVFYGLLVAPIPAALTIDHFHTFRLLALPLFLLLLTAPALEWLLDSPAKRRPLLLAALIATFLQGALFQLQFHTSAGQRWHSFDTFYPEVFAAAIAQPQRPIYLVDGHGAPGYIHAYWYGLFRGMTKSDFVRVPEGESAPAGALVISCETPCLQCDLILERASFRAFIAR